MSALVPRRFRCRVPCHGIASLAFREQLNPMAEHDAHSDAWQVMGPDAQVTSCRRNKLSLSRGPSYCGERRHVATGALSGVAAGLPAGGAGAMIHASIVVTILLMAAVTYVTRVIGYAGLRNRVLSPRVRVVMETAPRMRADLAHRAGLRRRSPGGSDCVGDNGRGGCPVLDAADGSHRDGVRGRAPASAGVALPARHTLPGLRPADEREAR